jgi:triosephosphate isomerase (TIM)
MLILNLKTYPESTAEKSVEIAQIIQNYQTENPQNSKLIHIAPSVLDIEILKRDFSELNIVSQNVDAVTQGASTGWIPVEELIELGVEISLYNHSEHRRFMGAIVDEIKKIQSKGMRLIVCCETIDEAKTILEANPYAIAYEPKDLIGSGVSVTTRPEIVKEFIKAVKDSALPIIGAGVASGTDIVTALELGAKGVLVSSAFVQSEDKLGKLQEFMMAF